jgi:hypothetical protein
VQFRATPCNPAKSRKTVPKSGASANFATFAFDYTWLAIAAFLVSDVASVLSPKTTRRSTAASFGTKWACLTDIPIVPWPMSCAGGDTLS